jgi:hypothetical protein
MTGKALTTILLATMAAATACSIKEYREDCPCFLSLDLRRAFDDIVNGPEELLLSVYCPETYYRETYLSWNVPDSLELRVPRGQVVISAISVRNSKSVKDKSLLISYGDQADSIYAFSATVDASGESASETVDLHKQYSTVYVRFVWPEDGAPSSNPGIRVKSSTNGLLLDALEPSKGAFCIELPEKDIRERQSFRIPRQTDKSLTLELFSRASEEILDSINLGEYIDRTGYDWNAEDLQDIYVEIDYTRTDAVVTVKEWDDEDAFTETI